MMWHSVLHIPTARYVYDRSSWIKNLNGFTSKIVDEEGDFCGKLFLRTDKDLQAYLNNFSSWVPYECGVVLIPKGSKSNIIFPEHFLLIEEPYV